MDGMKAPNVMRTGGENGTFACFDVFDTLLVLSLGVPEDLFLLLGRRLARSGEIECSAEIFAHQRRQAERRAFARSDLHPAIHEIYREVARGLELPSTSVTLLVNEELRALMTLLRPVPAAREIVQRARDAGSRVVYVTDTHLSAAFIEELLLAKGFFRRGDRVFSSCECRADKARGLLFPHVAETLRAPRLAIVHHGNDLVADVRNGRLSGWAVRHLREANLNRYERALSSENFGTGGLSSVFAGASRAARLASPTRDGRERILFDVTAGVGAPLLTGWVIWMLRRAAKAGCKRLYFISRDGQVLLEIARRIDAVMKTGMELRYLYGSRQSVLFANSADAALRNALRLRFCRLRDVAEALSLDLAEMAPFLPAHLLNSGQWTRQLSAREREQLRGLLDNERFRDLLRERSAAVRATLRRYLEQEGWSGDAKFGLVDVGWRGSMVAALTTAFGGTELKLPSLYLFFGLGDDAHRTVGAGNVDKLDAWFFDDASRHGFLPYLDGNTSLVEMFCAGDHGGVTGFRHDRGRVVPVLRTPSSPVQAWGLPVLRAAILSFVDNVVAVLGDDPETVDLKGDTREAVRKVMELFWLFPSPEEVRHWGSFPVEVDISNSAVLPLAEPLTFRHLLAAVRARRLALRSEHTWPHGSAYVSSLPFRALLRAGFWIKAKSPQTRRRMKWLKARLRNMHVF